MDARIQRNQKNFIAELRCHGLSERKIEDLALKRYVRHRHDEPPGRCLRGRWVASGIRVPARYEPQFKVR